MVPFLQLLHPVIKECLRNAPFRNTHIHVVQPMNAEALNVPMPWAFTRMNYKSFITYVTEWEISERRNKVVFRIPSSCIDVVGHTLKLRNLIQCFEENLYQKSEVTYLIAEWGDTNMYNPLLINYSNFLMRRLHERAMMSSRISKKENIWGS